MNMKKRYITLILVNLSFWLTMFLFLVYMVLLNGGLTANNLGLVVYAAAFWIIVFLYSVVYGIVSYLCVKNIFFSQLIFLSALLVALLIIYTPDVSSASAVVQAIKGIIRLMGIFMPCSLVPSFITMLIVKLVERSRQNKLNAEQPWNYPPSYPPQQ